MADLNNPTTMSDLDAVNFCLRAISSAPVSSLTGEVSADVATALDVLAEVNVEVQSTGWWFNTELEYPLNRDANDKIAIPDTYLSVDVIPGLFGDIDPVIRGAWLYDKKAHSTTFSMNLTGEVILLLKWDELPQVVRHYIAVRAARRFQAGLIGSQELDGFKESDEGAALVNLQNQETENADYSIFDNYSVARVLARPVNILSVR
jgi:hypothetical protein